jgi:RNA-directed DNA polymerase
VEGTTESRAIWTDRPAELGSGHSRWLLTTERPNNRGRRGFVKDKPMASDLQRELPPGWPEEERRVEERAESSPKTSESLMAQVLERENLIRALKQVQRNRGAPGIDGLKVEGLPGYLRVHWPWIRDALIGGPYRPQPVQRVMIPKPDGRQRQLGIPTLLDRFIQQAIAQVVQWYWEPHFHDQSYGFRPGHAFARYADDATSLCGQSGGG